ncbi:hypothetical protein TCAP_01049 [Tolypocladium capitatum]|uniref:Uncharacterized protein n=1 Tax=Tolypocladium capitatum TaxID=45235 RepID=A0A2K3QNC4_9HYPO|nr:hypothetical protein TCAP_01049 [Tolypocladium capitatum]
MNAPSSSIDTRNACMSETLNEGFASNHSARANDEDFYGEGTSRVDDREQRTNLSATAFGAVNKVEFTTYRAPGWLVALRTGISSVASAQPPPNRGGAHTHPCPDFIIPHASPPCRRRRILLNLFHPVRSLGDCSIHTRTQFLALGLLGASPCPRPPRPAFPPSPNAASRFRLLVPAYAQVSLARPRARRPAGDVSAGLQCQSSPVQHSSAQDTNAQTTQTDGSSTSPPTSHQHHPTRPTSPRIRPAAGLCASARPHRHRPDRPSTAAPAPVDTGTRTALRWGHPSPNASPRPRRPVSQIALTTTG